MKKYQVYTKEKGLVEKDDYINDNIQKLTWHRVDGPAVIYYNNDLVKYEEYWVNNRLHRLNGPAFIGYYNNGSVKYEEYWVNDKCHRLDGPAYIGYNNYGTIKYVAYWINDMEYTKEQYDKELLKLKVQCL